MRKKIILLAFILIWPFTVTAKKNQSENDENNASETTEEVTLGEAEQEGALRRSLKLEGGPAEDLVIADDGAVYAGLNSPNGIFVSPDGETWQSPPANSDFGTVSEIEVGENYVFITAGISLYRSNDQGVSWEELAGSTGDSRDNDYGQTMHYGGGRLFIADRDGTLDISEDEGETFTKVTVAEGNTTTWSIAASDTTDDVYLIASGNSEMRMLYHSDDGGETWMETDKSDTNYTNVYVKPGDADTVILIGSSAEITTTGVHGTWSTLASERVGAVNFVDDRIYLGGRYTDDQGITWNEIQDQGSTPHRLKITNYLAIDPNDDQHMVATSGSGMIKSADGGETWSAMNSGLYGVRIYDIAQSADKSIAWVAAYGGLAKTVNFDEDEPEWEFPVVPSETVDNVTAVWVNPTDADHVVAAAGSAIWVSQDSGETWSAGDVALENAVNLRKFAYREDDEILYVSYSSGGGDTVNGGVLQSTDGGETWSAQGLESVPVGPLAIDEDGAIYAGVGVETNSDSANRGVYKYVSGTWTQLNGAIDNRLVNDILIVDDVVFVAAGETSYEGSGVFRSTDAGVTWENLTDNGLAQDGWYHALVVEPDNHDVLYVSTARPAGTGKIYKSTNRGDTWSEYYTGLKDETFNAMLFDGLVTGTNTGLYSMQSKAKLTMKGKKRAIKKSRLTLTVTLKDAATDGALAQKKVVLFSKVKNGKWQKVKAHTTNTKGKATFKFRILRQTSLQARWTPASTDQESYGEAVQKSSTTRVSIKQKR